MAGRSRDIRTAINAAIALYHLREQLPPNKQITFSQIIERCPDYSLLRDVVNVSKHNSITRYVPQIRTADQIEEMIIITEYNDEQGKYKYIEKTVQLHLLDGSTRNMLEVLTNVMNFWQTYLHSVQIISNPHYYDFSMYDCQPKSREECGEANLGFEMLQGVHFHQLVCLQRYNYETGRVEPVDLTGSNVEFRIYKPPSYEVELTFTNNNSGQKISKVISLTEEENLQLFKIENEQEKQKFINSLPAFQSMARELVEELRSNSAADSTK